MHFLDQLLLLVVVEVHIPLDEFCLVRAPLNHSPLRQTRLASSVLDENETNHCLFVAFTISFGLIYAQSSLSLFVQTHINTSVSRQACGSYAERADSAAQNVSIFLFHDMPTFGPRERS